jgi:hypothetical protein
MQVDGSEENCIAFFLYRQGDFHWINENALYDLAQIRKTNKDRLRTKYEYAKNKAESGDGRLRGAGLPEEYGR